jgi:heme-degrading monooxygenase HmoA
VFSSSEKPAEFWLMTYWESEGHFREWHKHHRHESHQLMPKGLRLDASGTEVRVLNYIAS